MTWYFYIGLIAAACIAAFNLPQLIQLYKTKNTCGMSLGMLILLLAGDLCFVLNGIGVLADVNAIPETAKRISAGLPILLANAIATVMTLILLIAKIKSQHYANVFNVTEKQFCDNYETFKTKIKMIKAEKAAEKAKTAASDDIKI